MQRQQTTSSVATPMNAKVERPFPFGRSWEARLKEHQASLYVLVGVQQVVTDITDARHFI